MKGIEKMNYVLIGLGIYLVCMVAIGLYASRKVDTTEDFIVAGKRLSLPLLKLRLPPPGLEEAFVLALPVPPIRVFWPSLLTLLAQRFVFS